MFWISLGATKSVDSWPAGSEQRQLDNLSLRQLCLPLPGVFQCFVLCFDLSVQSLSRLEEVFLSNSTRTPTLGNEGCSFRATLSSQPKMDSFHTSSPEMPKCYKCYHQDGEVATEDLEIMLKYMGCILASTHDAHMDAHMWGVGTFASATLDFAPLCFLLPVPLCKHPQ